MIIMAHHDAQASPRERHSLEQLLRQHAQSNQVNGYANSPASPFAHVTGHHSVYNSPQFQQNGLQYLSQSNDSTSFSELCNTTTSGLGIDYRGSESQRHSNYQTGNAPAYEFMPAMTSNDQMVPRSLPDSRPSRTARAAARSHSPQNRSETSSRVTKPNKPKKPTKASSKAPQLDGPLSELTNDMSIPVRDMQEWVNRPLEVRLKEVEKRNGYVTRPMNSFMLYRSAYAERTKQFCIQNNHQVVSAVSGQSWPKEPAEVRDFYNHLARVERDNHARAHPSYKFSPSKTVAASYARRRKGFGSDGESDDDFSEAEADEDQEWVPRNGERKANRVSNGGGRKQVQETFPAYSQALNQPMAMTQPPQTAAQHWSLQQTISSPMSLDTQLAWQSGFDNRMGSVAQFDQSQQQHLHYHMMASPYYSNLANDFQHFHQTSPVVGLPSSDLFGSMQHHPFDSVFEADFQVDPMLLQFEHQQTPPIDDPATPGDDFDGISPLAGPNVSSSRSSAVPPKQSSLAFTAGTREMITEQQHDLPHHSFDERPSEFDGWMDMSQPAASLHPNF